MLLPLPPQIISLADLEVAVNNQPSESVEIRGDKLAWFGTLPGESTPMSIAYSAVGKGLYNLQTPPSGILDTFHIDLTAVGSDVRMLELSLQPTKYVRGKGQTVYTWDYKRLLFGRPIALDVLGMTARQAANGGVGDLRCDGVDGFEVAIGRDRETRLDDIDAKGLELARDLELFGLCEGGAGRLLAVAQGRVEDAYRVHIGLLSRFVGHAR